MQFKQIQWEYAYNIAIGFILGSLLYGILASHWRFCGSKNEHDCVYTESVEIMFVDFNIQFNLESMSIDWYEK